MKQDDMCASSICSFVRQVDTRVHPTFALVDNATSKTVRSLYEVYHIKLISSFDDDLPAPHPSWPIPYGFAKLRVWSMHRFDRILLFDPDVYFKLSPLFFFDKYASDAPNALAIRMRPFNTGVMLVRPNVTTYRQLVNEFTKRFVALPARAGDKCFDDQCWLQTRSHHFTIKPLDMCDNNKLPCGTESRRASMVRQGHCQAVPLLAVR